MILSFAGLIRPVALIGCDEFAGHIGAVLRGWQIEQLAENAAADDAVITVRNTDDGYSRTSRWLSEPAIYRHPVDAACDFVVDLMRAYAADNSSLLCLHCAAARLKDGLVIFPSTYKAGKSVLSAHLAAAGMRLFTDDVLPIETTTNHAWAPGILPRLRLPLPDDSSPEFRQFVDRHKGPRSDRYLYLALGEAALAPLGETAPIRGVVLLDREENAATDISPVGADEILQRTILRNFARNLSGLETLDRLHAIVDRAECFNLRYSSSEDAVAALVDCFGGRARAQAG